MCDERDSRQWPVCNFYGKTEENRKKVTEWPIVFSIINKVPHDFDILRKVPHLLSD
jgi:hypothetical protein